MCVYYVSFFIIYTIKIIHILLASPYGATKRIRWSDEEKEAALRAFSKHMENLTLPSLAEIQEMKKIYTSLACRTSPQIKTWLHNKQKAVRSCK